MIQTVHTADAPEAIGPYSQAKVYNGIVYTSGQIPINPATGEVEGSTIHEQAERVIANLSAVLKASGSSLEKVIKTTCFLKNMTDFAEFNRIYAAHFPGKPARSCVAVKELPRDVLVEIEAVAAV